MKTTVVLVRHGETDWNIEGRIQGHTDIPLNEIGVAQADATGKRLRGEHFDAIYSSDLARAYSTALPAVADASRIVREPRLRERNLGVLQGLDGAEARAKQPAAWKVFKARDPGAMLEGGESLGHFARRAVMFVEEAVARHAGGRLLIVTHGGLLDAIYRHATGMAPSADRDFPIYNASVNVLSHDAGRWRVESWGDISHLPRELTLDDA
ncbi:MAG: histidine phosphatase family protein [Pseudoxanthomonas sp.]